MMLNSLTRPVWCAPLMVTHSIHLWRIYGLETLINWIISWTTIPVFLTSWTSMIWFKVAQELCLLQKKDKLQVNVHEVDGTEWAHILCSMKFSPKVGVNLFTLHANFHREKQFQVITKTTSWSVLWAAILSLIAKSRLVMVGLLESSFFKRWEDAISYCPSQEKISNICRFICC